MASTELVKQRARPTVRTSEEDEQLKQASESYVDSRTPLGVRPAEFSSWSIHPFGTPRTGGAEGLAHERLLG